jgi:hypothetical protein
MSRFSRRVPRRDRSPRSKRTCFPTTQSSSLFPVHVPDGNSSAIYVCYTRTDRPCTRIQGCQSSKSPSCDSGTFIQTTLSCSTAYRSCGTNYRPSRASTCASKTPRRCISWASGAISHSILTSLHRQRGTRFWARRKTCWSFSGQYTCNSTA